MELTIIAQYAVITLGYLLLGSAALLVVAAGVLYWRLSRLSLGRRLAWSVGAPAVAGVAAWYLVPWTYITVWIALTTLGL